jgi:hypothetical protein
MRVLDPRERPNNPHTPRGTTIPTGPFVRAATVSKSAAKTGNPRRSCSSHRKRAIRAPAILVARIVSTRHEEEDFNHSKLVNRIREAISAVSREVLPATKAKNAYIKRTKATADGRRQLASVTSPAGIDARDINQ